MTVATESELPVTVSDPPAADDFGLSASFESWLHAIEKGIGESESGSPETTPENEIYIGSFPGSNFELAFEGILHFDGYSIGNITSPDGTLVLTNRGRVEADINVGTAIINGSVIGTIRASERVVLESEAKVIGQIITPALSIRLGAVYDGDCLFPSTAHSSSDGSLRSNEAEEFSDLLVGV
jgi:cytoskeletal protein CcmA (bactofilin family)